MKTVISERCNTSQYNNRIPHYDAAKKKEKTNPTLNKLLRNRGLNYSKQQTSLSRSSRPEVFCKKGVLRNFAKFTGK